MSDVEPTTGQPDARYFAHCSECEWTSQGYRFKAGAEGAADIHNDRKARGADSHVTAGAGVKEVNSDGE